MWIVILGVGAVFVLYLGFAGGLGGGNDPQSVVWVGERRYDAREVDRVRRATEDQYRQSMGDQFDPDNQATQDFLIENAANSLLRAGLIAELGERMGLAVSDAETRAWVRSIPGALDDEGRVNRDAVSNWAEQQWGSLRRFQERVRDDLLMQKTLRLVRESVQVSEAEARDAVRYGQEEIRLALVQLQPDADVEVEVPEEAGQALLEADPDRIREAYDSRRDEFDKPEEVRARHILIRIDPEAGDEGKAQARGEIDGIRAQLLEGADFEDLALERSADPGSKDKGGDLGFFARGHMVKAFEDVAFSIEPGVLSEVVETSFGFHLIQVEEKRPATVVSFEEAREILAQELAESDAAAAVAETTAQELADAIRAGSSLVDAARERELPILRPDPVRRRADGYLPEVGMAPEVMAAAFALTADAPSDPTVHKVGDDRFVMVQLLERNTPSDEEVANQAPAERERLLRQRQAETENRLLDALRAELEARRGLGIDLTAMRS
jgi:peptidyl-prolyl cis-trans isomerase D